jgi:hypothetical protein
MNDPLIRFSGGDHTVITFDQPDERVITLNRLLPLLRRNDWIELDGISHIVRSAGLEIDTKAGAVTMYIRLRL